jgi:hypothetical protein
MMHDEAHLMAIRATRRLAKPMRFGVHLAPRPLTIAEGVEAIGRWRAAWPELAAALKRIGQYASSRKADAVARGPLPRDRIAAPAPGHRCPRCHRAAWSGPCLLCRPDLVPATRGGRAVFTRQDAAIVAACLPPRVR